MHAIQMQLEASLKQAVAATLAKKCVIIYDRGVLDGASPVGERERSHALYATLEHLRVCVRAHVRVRACVYVCHVRHPLEVATVCSQSLRTSLTLRRFADMGAESYGLVMEIECNGGGEIKVGWQAQLL